MTRLRFRIDRFLVSALVVFCALRVLRLPRPMLLGAIVAALWAVAAVLASFDEVYTPADKSPVAKDGPAT